MTRYQQNRYRKPPRLTIRQRIASPEGFPALGATILAIGIVVIGFFEANPL